MTVLITGVSGLIGRAVAARFIRGGWQVRGAVRRTGAPPGVIAFNKGEISGTTDWTDALDHVDVVVHIAGYAHMRPSPDSAELERVNVEATLALAKAAARTVGRFVFVSTAKVHGERSERAAFSEADAPNPLDPYARSKLRAEIAVQDGARGSHMETVIVRPALVYGPGVKANFLSLLRLVERRVPMPFGAIHNTRSYVYVANLADAIFGAATHSSATGSALLITDGDDVSTPALIRKLAAAMNRPARLYSVPPGLLRFTAGLIGRGEQVGKLLDSFAIDSSETRKRLNWHPPFTMDEGLQATAAWYLASRQ
jgi:nucleoside-diphosphate-sugar epimerase